jgi:cytochrome P450
VSVAESVPDLLAAAVTPEFRNDPYPFFHALRAAAPVTQASFGVWLVSRHADVATVTRDHRLSNDEANSILHQDDQAAAAPRGQADDGVLLFLDPPDHTRLRGLVSKAFTPRTIERLRGGVRELVDQLIDAAVQRGGQSGGGEMDVIADLAYPLPVIVICELLGVPASDHVQFQGWSKELAASIDPRPLRTPEQQASVAVAAGEFSEYFADLVARRRRSPGDDLLSGLIAAEEDGDRLSERELLNTGMFLLVAGHETTVNLIGNGVFALLGHPDECDRLRRDPALDRPAVEELLRFDSPVQITERITVADYEIGGVTIPPGYPIIPLLGAANRDPEVFADPDRLDLSRANAQRHLAFGGGHHYCLGAALARLEGEIAIPSLVRRFPDMELAGDPVRRETFTLRGLERLPVSTGG